MVSEGKLEQGAAGRRARRRCRSREVTCGCMACWPGDVRVHGLVCARLGCPHGEGGHGVCVGGFQGESVLAGLLESRLRSKA